MNSVLDELCIHHGTSKGSEHPVKGQDYARHYERLFAPLQFDRLKLLEIGVGGGESIKVWLDYFSLGKIHGVDLVHDTNPYNTPGSKAVENYTFNQGDQSSEVFWKCFITDHGSDWDIIIDDGSHYAHHVLDTFKFLWPHVKRCGLYCIEDLACSYGGPPFTETGKPTHMDFIKASLDQINQQSDIDSLHFSKELAIFRKA